MTYYAKVAHYPSPVWYMPTERGKMSITVDERTGKLPVVGLRNSLLTGRRPASVQISEDAPLRVHTLQEKGVGVWMTDLPEELQQVEDFLHQVGVHGKRVLVGGLGLGIVAARLSQMGAEVTVVERSRNLIGLIRAATWKWIPYTMVCSDISKYLTRCQPFDAYYLDTWQGTNESTWWDTVLPLRCLLGRRFGGVPVYCWAEDIMLGQVKQAIVAHAASGRPAWHYAKLPTETDPEHFVTGIGTPEWEKRYGVGLGQEAT